MPKEVKKYIKGYLSEDKRVNKRLNHLVPLLNQIKDPVYQIAKRINQTTNPLKLFKILILIHVCNLRQVLNYQGALKLLSSIKPKQGSKLHLKKTLAMDTIPKYKLYLQMCYEQKKQQWFRQKQKQNDQNYSQQPIQQVYKLMRMLEHGLDFVNILFLFGRYYRESHKFIIDFNIVLAKDLQMKYNRIASIVANDQSLLNEILIQKLEKLHEQMYILYYNCYFVSEVRRFTPKWIQMDKIGPINNASSKYDYNQSQLLKMYIEEEQKFIDILSSKKVVQNKTPSTKSTLQKSEQKKIEQDYKISKFSQYQHDEQICQSEQQQNQKLNETKWFQQMFLQMPRSEQKQKQRENYVKQFYFDDIDIQSQHQICGDLDYLTALLSNR